MSKTIKKIGLAIVAIALEVALLIAGSYALFTDTITVSHHLQAGKLEATLTRKTLMGNQIDIWPIMKVKRTLILVRRRARMCLIWKMY